MSRQPTWDLACKLQGEMFAETARIGGLDVQLVYFRGLAECKASKWASDAARLGNLMARIACRGGNTQIGRVLDHAIAETRRNPIRGLVFVGDAMEENIDALCAKAGQLALLGVPVFVFQEGRNPVAEGAFREIARISRGAWSCFDPAPRRNCGSCCELLPPMPLAGARRCCGYRRLAAAPPNCSAR